MNKNTERIEKLANVLKSYAYTDDEKKMVDNFTDKHQTTDAERIIELVGAIYDGIAYGNWPWVIAKLNAKANSVDK